MSFPEDQLRDALHADEPEPLDPDRIIRGARRRRARTFTQIGVGAAAAVLVAGVGVQMLGQQSGSESTSAGAPAATSQRAIPPSQRDEAQPAPAPTEFARERDYIPGMTIRLEGEQWCITTIGQAGGDCVSLTQFSQRVPDVTGTDWLVVLAPSGPRTAVLQAEQNSGWVSLRTSRFGESSDQWVGVIPTSEVPDAKAGLRAVDSTGTEIWHQ